MRVLVYAIVACAACAHPKPPEAAPVPAPEPVAVAPAAPGPAVAPLVEETDIIEMAKSGVVAQMPRLRSCYEDVLKTRPDFAGQWTLQFVIEPSGAVADATVKGVDAHDEDFERCLAARVAGWQFQPIEQSLPVKKSVTFRPGT